MMATLFTLVLLTASSCSGLFYYPTSALYSNPSELGLEYQNLYFQTEDQQQLHAWYFPTDQKQARGLIFFFHGNAQNITSHYRSLSWLVSRGYGLFIFDYRGYGLSSGRPSQAGLLMDSRAAYEQVKKLQDEKSYPQLIFYGQSLGGNVMMRFLEEVDSNQVDLVVLDSTFSSYQGIARYKVKKSGVLAWLSPFTSILVDESYAPDEFFESWKGRVLVIHGDQDQVVEPHFGREIFERLQTPSKDFWSVTGGGHIDAYFLPQEDYQQKLLDYLKAL